MHHQRYFSYVRVSTQRQGQSGTSLVEQSAAIERYADRWNLPIIQHFEERETAAKQGRPVFLEMLKALKTGKADGVVIHKIDRSARNLKDWADLGALIDSGVEVHFANESLDLNSRGGRLSADIQAVVASDYIRNLREETKKGIYGRLKQGLYPFPAVIGYKNAGKGEPKRVDPVQAPLIKKAFELYSTGRWGLIALADKLYDLGLRNKNNKKVTINGLSVILHNPFYFGIIRIEKTGELFAGKHRPVITKALFDRVQAVFAGKNIKKTERHFFVFRRRVNCAKCGNLFIPERIKDWIYYRCHTRGCTRGALKEETIEQEMLVQLKKLQLTDAEYRYFKQQTAKESRNLLIELQASEKQIQIQQEQIKDRLSKLADAYVDEVFDSETYFEKKNQLLLENQSLTEKQIALKPNTDLATKRMDAFLELVNSAYLSYKIAKGEEKRDLVEQVVSNCAAMGKSVTIKLEIPFQLMAERPRFTAGSPQREATRTLRSLVAELLHYFAELDTSKNDDKFVNYTTLKNEKIKENNVLNSNG